MTTGKPEPMPVKPDNIPGELKTGRQFVCWRWELIKGKWTKPPYHPQGHKAKSNDPSTWVTFNEALEAHQAGKFDGIGRCFAHNDPFCAIDLDNCKTNGQPEPWAAQVLSEINSYAELTPSGNGYRPWAIGEKPGTRSGKNKEKVGVELEIYDRTSTRYVTLTGHVLNGHTRVEARQPQINEVYHWYYSAPKSDPAPEPPQGGGAFQWDGNIDHIPIRPETRQLILSGCGPVGERSEKMMSVLNALVWSNLSDPQIIEIFEQHPVGDKYREKGNIREQWLQAQIEKARSRVTNRAEATRGPHDSRGQGGEKRETPERPRVLCATSLLEISSEKIETRPLADGFIDEEEKIVFHGEGGCKKSLLMLNLAAVIASGQTLLWDKFQVPRPLNFLFVQSENGRKSLNERARKMVQGNPALAKGFVNIFFAGIDGGVELAGAVSEKSFRDDVYECAKATGVQLDGISFDPLISYHDADENDNSRMRTTLDWISEIAANIGADPFVIHHDNRMGAIRGASAITDWTRHKIHVFLTSNPRRIQLVSEKRNNAEKFKSFLLEMDDFLNFKYLEVEDGLNPKLVKRCQDVKDALSLQGGSVETQAQLVKQYREKTGVKNDSTIRNHIQAAVSAGFIFCEYYEEDGIKKCKYRT